LGREAHRFVDAVGCRPANRRLGGGDLDGIVLSVLHKKPRLMIGYMATRHKGDSPFSENHPRYRANRDHETPKNCAAAGV
jgi:hypothetical protein